MVVGDGEGKSEAENELSRLSTRYDGLAVNAFSSSKPETRHRRQFTGSGGLTTTTRCRRPDRSFPRSGRSPRQPRSWYAISLSASPRSRPCIPFSSAVPKSHLTTLPSSSQTASTHLREGLLCVCPVSDTASDTLREALEMCDAEHKRLGVSQLDATDEDKQLLLLLSTAAKTFLLRLEETSVVPDESIRDVWKRAWLPLLSEGKGLDDDAQRQVIDECITALTKGPKRWELVSDLLFRCLERLGLVDNEKQKTNFDYADVFTSLRFESAVELATALMGVVIDVGQTDNESVLKLDALTLSDAQETKNNALKLCVVALVAVAELDAKRLSPSHRRQLLACIVPAAANAAACLGTQAYADATSRFADATLARVGTILENTESDPESTQFFFDTLGLDAARALVLGTPGNRREEVQNVDTNNALIKILAFGIASEDRRDRRSALGAIRHALGVSTSENSTLWIFDDSPWCEFAALVDALDDFAAHLVEAAWEHIDVLHPSRLTGASHDSPRDAHMHHPAMHYQFVVSAWTCGLKHANPVVRAKTLQTFCARSWGSGGESISICVHIPTSFVTDVLLPCAMDMLRDTIAFRPFLESFVGCRVSSSERRAVTKQILTAVTTHAPKTNTRGLDVGASVLSQAAQACEASEERNSQGTLDELRVTLDVLCSCAAALLDTKRTSNPEALVKRTKAVFHAARVLAPASACAEAAANSTTSAQNNKCFLSTMRLLAAVPSETMDGNKSLGVSHSARSDAAEWLRDGGSWYYEALTRAVFIFMFGAATLTDAKNSNGLQEFEYDPRNREELENQTVTETATLVANADALASAWSFVESRDAATEITGKVAECAMYSHGSEEERRRKTRSQVRRRALLLLRSSFRLAGALSETKENLHRAERNGCVAFLAAKRDTYQKHVHENLHFINKDACTLCDGVDPDIPSERFAIAATGASEAVWRWLTRNSDAYDDGDWFKCKMHALCLAVMYCEKMGDGYAHGLTPSRRADCALAAASHARGFVALWSGPTPERLARMIKAMNLNLERSTVGNILKCLSHLEYAVDALVSNDIGGGRMSDEYVAESVRAVAAAWTATSAMLSIFSPTHESLKNLDPNFPPLEDHELKAPRVLLKHAIAFIPTAAEHGADVFRETWRAIGKLLTVMSKFPDLQKHLPELARDLLNACLLPCFKSSRFRKNAPVWQAVVSAALHPALFELGMDERKTLHSETGACVSFVKLSVSVAKKSGGARVARVVSHALAARLIDRPEHAFAYAPYIFDLGIAGEGEQTRAERLAIAAHWAERELEPQKTGTNNESDEIRDAVVAGRDSHAFARWLDFGGIGGSAKGHVAARVAVLTLTHALAVGEPPSDWQPLPTSNESTESEKSKDEIRASYLIASRRAARAILRVALDAVSGGDPDLIRESYRRGSLTHRRKVRAWQMLCTSSPALAFNEPKSVTEKVTNYLDEQTQLEQTLVAAAPFAISRRELPGVRYYSEAFMCLTAQHVPGLLKRVALPALYQPEEKTFVAASWIVVATGAALRRKREEESEAKNDSLVSNGTFMYSPQLLLDARMVFAAVFPWSMAHNHTLRVFAQAAVRDMLEQFGPKTFSDEKIENHETETFSQDALVTTLALLTSNEEMRKTRDACGDLFTQNLDPTPKALLQGLLDIEPKQRSDDTNEIPETETDTNESTDPVSFEGAPLSAIDRVDAFLQHARMELRVEREAHDAALWWDAMRCGHDLRMKVEGVVGDDFDFVFSSEDNRNDSEDADFYAVSSAFVLQKKVIGSGDTAKTGAITSATSTRITSNAVDPGMSNGSTSKDTNPFVPPFATASALETGENLENSTDTETQGGQSSDLSMPTTSPNTSTPTPTPTAYTPPKPRPPGLIVLASLVEKIPNLAGLTRTCEVMGAEALVVADGNVVKHKDFVAVSVTAERWLPVRECPINGIVPYLHRLRREGYQLIGLEQTRGAVSVEAHEFSKKTVLVLGREREGVDADVLRMLDQCVVIPQRGMIRSLNVHVSASIAVQRYAAVAVSNGW